MTNTTARTPGPWTWVSNSWSDATIYDAQGRTIATLSIADEATEETQDALEGEQAANAAFIVRAANSHAELLEVLRGVEAWLTDDRLIEVLFGPDHDIPLAASHELVVRAVRAALAKARQP